MHRSSLFALLIITMFSGGGQAIAAGGGGGGGEPIPTCAKGLIYDTRTKKCVPQSGMLDDESIYQNGRQLALRGDYDEAIRVLSLAHDKNDSRILNYLGYSHRKAGRVLVGLGYYNEALRADPGNTLVREYLGEAHLQMGDVISARYQLGEIEKRCGLSCDEYKVLAAQIASHPQ